MNPVKPRVRCAIYTRKSCEEGLEQEFNSLDAQRQHCESFIASQQGEGWLLVPDYYDDGGFSGGNIERPALKRLLKDIEAGLIDTVVVYKIDRLSRSLLDFLNMVQLFEKKNVTFVSVTQHFNTSTPMGKLMLNVLLSFAQFEREITGERIRDKIAASKRKGMWMGGVMPIGYDAVNRKLVINEAEAETVRHIFRRFVTLGSVTALARDLRREGYRTKSYVTCSGRRKEGRAMDKGFLYNLLKNRLYLGEIRHKDQTYPGQHQPIIDAELWQQVQEIIAVSPRKRGAAARCQTPALLRSVARCGGCRSAMTPAATRKGGKLYRYYTPSAVMKDQCAHCPVGRVPAGELEELVIAQLRAVLRAPEIILRTWEAAQKYDKSVSEHEVREALCDTDAVWNELFPLEQERIVKLLVESVVVGAEGVDIRIRADGINTLVREVRAMSGVRSAA